MIDPKSLKIGDTVYFIRPGGWKGHFERKLIAGETSRSWIVLSPCSDTAWMAQRLEHFGKKIPKHFNGYTLGTAEEASLLEWVMEHKGKVAYAIEWGTPTITVNADMLLQIAKLIGYSPLPEVK